MEAQPTVREAPGRRPVVCQLLHSLNVGGAEVLAYRLAREMREEFEFLFVCLDDLGPLGEQLADQGFDVARVQRRPGWDFHCMRRLGALFAEKRVELVHAHQYTPFFYALASRGMRRMPPILFTEHGRWYPDTRSWKRVCFNRLMLSRTDRVVGVGNSVRQALIDNEGLPPNRVGVIYNGVDFQQFSGQEHLREEVRRELGVSPETFVILQVARLDHLKDHPTALEAMALLVERHPDCRLFLVGEGPERTAIESRIRELKLADRVTLLGLRHDVSRLLSGGDAFLLTSISEGIPVTVIECMCAGLPVVSTDVGGVSEVIEHDRSGLLAPAKDSGELARQLSRLSDSPDLPAQLAAHARDRVKQLFSQEQMHQSYAETYRKML